MKGFIEKLEELLELGGTKRDLKRPVLLFIKFNIWFIFLSLIKVVKFWSIHYHVQPY